MGKIIRRVLDLKLPPKKSAFLWGPRQVGKSYWIREHLPKAKVIDLLKSDDFADYAARPARLREQFAKYQGLLVIDEVQKVPALLDEVHWLIENRGVSFLLTGSSGRKLKRGGANLLGGRAWKRSMKPLCFPEIKDWDLETGFISGFLPPSFLSEHPEEELRAYVADYLKEEIAAEALAQNIPAFHEFLKVAALTSSELLNYTNVARESGISQKTVRHYFQILEDTYLGFRLQPYKKVRNRRLIETEKFYLFDVGVTNYLSRQKPKSGTPEFGKSFEQYLLMELLAYQAYRKPEMEINFWRTAHGQEVDFILNDKEVAIEVKGSHRVHEGDLKGLLTLLSEGSVGQALIVSQEKTTRQIHPKILSMPWKKFLTKLWDDDLV